MRADPPAELVELLERLRLATAEQVRGVYPRVTRLAGELPLFSSVWVDALAQARVLTPFQATEINGGRGKRLAIGPYVVISPIWSLGYADFLRAGEIESRRTIDLLVAKLPSARQADCLSRIEELIKRLKSISTRHIVAAASAGGEGDHVWIASLPIDAMPLRELVLNKGRLAGEAVLEIARQMAAALAELEAARVVHGDISATAVWVAGDGTIRLRHSGVRGILRPEEGFAHAELPPEAYDGIAPERVADATAPTVASDMFACGCLWWHLLAGRPPLAGGTSLAKLWAAQAAKICDVVRFAPDAPAALVAAIAACIQRDPRKRPESFAALARRLGPASPAGRRAIQQAVAQIGGRPRGIVSTAGRVVRSKEAPAWIATIAGCIAVMVAVSWPLWRPQPSPAIGQHSPFSSEPAVTAPPRIRPSSVASSRPISQAKSQPRADAEPASYLELAGGVAPLVLPGIRPTVWNAAQTPLKAGLTVRGQPGQRPMIVVPPGGIIVAVEDVRFEKIDFVWRQSPDAAIDPEHLALIDLRAARAGFKDCTFQSAANERVGRPTAIRWTGPGRSGPLPPAGRLQINGCVLTGMAAGIDCRLTTPLAIKVTDTLQLGLGPFIRFDHAPRVDEPIEIELTHSTLREAAALIGFHVDRLSTDEKGTIGILTNNCSFVPSRGGALVLFAAPEPPTILAKSLQWSGQGSVLSADSSVALWLAGSQMAKSREIEVAVDGLVSSQIEFAGPIDAGSSASRVIRWLAPGASVDPPGIPDGLPNIPSFNPEPAATNSR
jgi:eukaryotic-like serine/threonine-protein kinase